jgi:hypothetical protein
MSSSRLHIFWWGLVSAAFFALLSASLGAGEAQAGSCVAANFTFNLGNANPNTCNTTTSLDGTGAMVGLDVFDATPGANALQGRATASTGDGIGVAGSSSSSGAFTYGVLGRLFATSVGTNSAGVYGLSTATGGAGVRGQSDSSQAGLFETLQCDCPAVVARASKGALPGVQGNGAVGVQGIHLDGSGAAPGVEGVTQSGQTDASGVRGIVASNASGAGSAGVWGINNGSATNTAGAKGSINSNADYSAGVRGENSGTSCCGFGVVGFHAGQGIGIGGYAPNGFGVFGWSPNNWAAYFDGAVEVVRDLHVNGTLYKGAGAFRIDNPLDPAHSYLQHSFVESPQMMNVYNGNITTDAKGFATVHFPKWFQVLNKDFRYQLTVIDKAHWTARAAVWEKIHENHFTIRTDQGNVDVSWQVTGVRHDLYANAHRIQVVVPKRGQADGTYLHPRLYGQPQSKGETALPGFARRMPKLKAPASPVLPNRH